MHEIEIEFKNLLSQQAYVNLSQAYKDILSSPVKQVNYYFDREGFLRNKGAALRIRVKEGKSGGQLTLKVRTSRHQLEEIHEVLTQDQVDKFLGLGQVSLSPQMLGALDLSPEEGASLSLLGSLTTLRQEGWLDPNHLLVLDQSDYHGLRDYEIELEARDEKEGQAFFENLLAQHAIPHQPSPSKLARFLASIDA